MGLALGRSSSCLCLPFVVGWKGNVPHRLPYLNTWSVVGNTVWCWGGYGILWGGEWHLAGRSTLSLGVNGVNVECLEPHYTSCSLPASCVWVPCDQPASRSAGVPHSSSWEPKATRFYPNSFITATEKEEKQLYVPNEKVGIRMEVSLLRATSPLHPFTLLP